ncbi:Chaperone protein DnaJ [uncultured archaeon]|nr:Chaperone protein DnaJ [uncultured archaeon]
MRQPGIMSELLMVKVKGHELGNVVIKDAFNRRALQFKNNIITVLKRIGVNEYDIDVDIENMAIKKAKASATWYQAGHRMHYSHNLQNKFVDNLNVVFKVIQIEVNQVLSEKKTLEEFIAEFKEDSDVEEKRKEAREFLGIGPDVTDIELINKKYKDMARELHPDMPNGDTEKFKQLNNAHKILKRELS